MSEEYDVALSGPRTRDHVIGAGGHLGGSFAVANTIGPERPRGAFGLDL